ncbi:HET-domain-containing protein [Paraphaeosphaeria sporulosa]|uniref:HET-domain-containing protein n=1 Tax=Paraphaeosphaeria sporulosa TaxID=1460663 RepID=A0A177CVE4_9PLEO|nr:HET-domain-containing protein [Paraphaeosphaeria sporulosa]OAG11534.1 HET-domain-containing protein [Paraphaeosphaeria sporulosa]
MVDFTHILHLGFQLHQFHNPDGFYGRDFDLAWDSYLGLDLVDNGHYGGIQFANEESGEMFVTVLGVIRSQFRVEVQFRSKSRQSRGRSRRRRTYDELRFWATTANEYCEFCILIKDVLVSHYGKEYIETKLAQGYTQKLYLYRNPLDLTVDKFDGNNTWIDVEKPCYLAIACSSPKALWGIPGATFRREDRARSDERNRDWVMPAIFAVRSEFDYTSGSIQRISMEQPGRLVNHKQIDWTLIATWDSACSHGIEDAPGHTGSEYRSRLRVIDVEKACIVRCPHSAPYVALSYQWGSDQNLKLKKENVALLETSGFFDTPEGQPAQTIRDAIAVVKKLGYKYAWVDALCIIQDDVDNVVLNVDQMDQIYRGAHLTIVAAAGKNAYYGLPGVSTTPRSEVQLKAVIGDTVIASMLETGQGAIDFSRWSTRAWTYQERLLSNRLLIFTESQVFFNCSAGCNFQEQYHFIPSSMHRYTLNDPQASFDFETDDLWEVYAIAVSEYTKRVMTDSRDKVRAFSGILKFLERPYGAPFFYGLPTTLFEVALLWKPRGACERTELGFPSWSWAGWDVDVLYEMLDSMNNFCECLVSQAHISIPGTNLELAACVKSPPQTPPQWDRHFDEDELTIHYTSSDATFARFRYPRPLPRVPETDFMRYASISSPLLHVTARTATFLLTEQHSHTRDNHTRNKTPCRDGAHELCYLAILDAQNHTAGTIIVSGRLLPQLANKTHSFLAIARSTLSRMDNDASWDATNKRFTFWTEQSPESQQQSTLLLEDGPSLGTKFDWSVGADEDQTPNDDFFDARYFSAGVYWPAIDVLLLSEEKDGVVERLGVGKIHVDAFEPIAQLEQICLG